MVLVIVNHLRNSVFLLANKRAEITSSFTRSRDNKIFWLEDILDLTSFPNFTQLLIESTTNFFMYSGNLLTLNSNVSFSFSSIQNSESIYSILCSNGFISDEYNTAKTYPILS
ncbi:hypothetical protein (P1r) [Rice black streaked dwarf virus]|uniref:Uncharacterized protein n=1 Tax=Rice black streaked dwarf virus TaxID=10990 RepID=Q8UZ07_RBSDV|nr:hypothetical protein (P1r) [Rice black streaked dwarf virus]CAC82520.1 hypothetical protein (P1r) [Rice black streaked dwarf virus]